MNFNPVSANGGINLSINREMIKKYTGHPRPAILQIAFLLAFVECRRDVKVLWRLWVVLSAHSRR